MWVFRDPDWMQWISECVRDNRLLFHGNHSQLGEQMKEFRPNVLLRNKAVCSDPSHLAG